MHQIESTQVGVITVLKGKQTRRKYHVATIFVDHFSKWTYVHFGKINTVNEAVEKKSFEQYAAIFGVKFKNTMLKMVPSITAFSKRSQLPQTKPFILVVFMHITRTEFLRAW